MGGREECSHLGSIFKVTIVIYVRVYLEALLIQIFSIIIVVIPKKWVMRESRKKRCSICGLPIDTIFGDTLYLILAFSKNIVRELNKYQKGGVPDSNKSTDFSRLSKSLSISKKKLSEFESVIKGINKNNTELKTPVGKTKHYRETSINRECQTILLINTQSWVV